MKKLINPRIEYVSLVRQPVSRMRSIVKGDGTFELAAVCKGSTDGKTLTSIVYAPGRADAEGEFADADSIREMAYSHAENGFKLDLRHDGKPLPASEAHVAESFIIAKGDPRFLDWKDMDGHPVETEGAWGQVIALKSEALRERCRKGELQGVSMFGRADREEVAKGDFAKFLDFFRDAFAPKPEKTMPITAEESAKIAKDAADLVLKGLRDGGVIPEPKKADAAPAAPAALPPDYPVFKGDVAKPEDIDAFEAQIADYEIRKGLESIDPKVRAEALAKARARNVTKGDAKAPASSNAPAADVKKGDEAPAADCSDFWKPKKT